VLRQEKPLREVRINADDYRALAEFRYRVRVFLTYSERNARQAGIHPQQHRLMLAVKGMPANVAPSIRNIAQRLQIEHHSAVELIDRAAAKGLVVRRGDSGDRRVVHIEITPKGEKILALLSMRNKEELRQAAPALVRALRSLTRERAAQSRMKEAAHA
jgi:DNA-binding MarR family transcriptional regulator